MFLMQRTMLEPGVRYLPHVPLQAPLPSHISLEAAVDLSKKSEDWGSRSTMEIDDHDDSDSDTPLDMSVTASRLTPVFPGFSRDLSPARSDRSDQFVRSHGFYSPVPHARDWSTERSEADKDEFPMDGCHLCGMPRSEMAAHDHVDGACNQRTISCALCAKTFTLWSHYEAHKKCHQKLKQRQYPCQSCGKIFTSASNRNMHQRIHKGVRPFHCVPCGVYFRQKAHLQKHQRTQGHIQASELFEKKRSEGLITELDHLPREVMDESEDSGPTVGSSPSSINDDENNLVIDASSSSPKRKQSHPQHQSLHQLLRRGEEEDDQEEEEERNEEEENISPREEVIRSNIEYNTMSHVYDCRQCDFSSLNHSATRDHVSSDHMRDTAELQCKECMITFTKPFNLQIHIRKHETASQFLPCEFCEQVFKVPNKLIKHMEGVHSVCPTCGKKNEDKCSLVAHMETEHNEVKRGVHINIQHLSSLASLLPAKHRFDIDSRHAKMRKLDTLAEHIRAKQLQNANGTNIVMNGNEKMSTSKEQMYRDSLKNDMMRIHEKRSDIHHYIKPDLESLVSHLNRANNPLIKSENNNVLTSLGKMSEMPERRIYEERRRPHEELTPPCSPPTSDNRITSNVILINNNPTCESDDSNETGLDLTLKKERRNDEAEVSTTEAPPEDYFRGRILTPSFPYIVPSLPFLTRMPIGPLQHHNNSFTEHLFKLASISRPASQPQDLSKPVTSPAGHHTVLSAMLGHRPPVPHQSVFPVFGGRLPASMFPQHPLPPRPEDTANSPVPSLVSSSASGFESKPFRCSYCPKEFGHLSSLESHVERLHTNESKHHCEACGRAFSSKSNLTAHKKIHTGERPFECSVCQKKFRQKAHLQKHETTHSSATPYQCPHCDKAFGHPSNLNTHIATHSDVRPYECTDCGKAYKDSASFKRHRLVHSGERPHSCNLCTETFIDSKSLKRHREITHPLAPKENGSGEEIGDDEEEFIEPGLEEQFVPLIKEEAAPGAEGVDGVPGVDGEGYDDDLASCEGDLEIAETSADSGINSSMDQSINQSL